MKCKCGWEGQEDKLKKMYKRKGELIQKRCPKCGREIIFEKKLPVVEIIERGPYETILQRTPAETEIQFSTDEQKIELRPIDAPDSRYVTHLPKILTPGAEYIALYYGKLFIQVHSPSPILGGGVEEVGVYRLIKIKLGGHKEVLVLPEEWDTFVQRALNKRFERDFWKIAREALEEHGYSDLSWGMTAGIFEVSAVRTDGKVVHFEYY